MAEFHSGTRRTPNGVGRPRRRRRPRRPAGPGRGCRPRGAPAAAGRSGPATRRWGGRRPRSRPARPPGRVPSARTTWLRPSRVPRLASAVGDDPQAACPRRGDEDVRQEGAELAGERTTLRDQGDLAAGRQAAGGDLHAQGAVRRRRRPTGRSASRRPEPPGVVEGAEGELVVVVAGPTQPSGAAAGARRPGRRTAGRRRRRAAPVGARRRGRRPRRRAARSRRGWAAAARAR